MCFSDDEHKPEDLLTLFGGDHLQKISQAKDPTICSCEYRNCEYLLRWRSLWGHEPYEWCAGTWRGTQRKGIQ